MAIEEVKHKEYYHPKRKRSAHLIPGMDVFVVRDDSIADLRTEKSLVESGRRPVLQEDTNQQ